MKDVALLMDQWRQSIEACSDHVDWALLQQTVDACESLDVADRFPFACHPLEIGLEIASHVLPSRVGTDALAAAIALPYLSYGSLSSSKMCELFSDDVCRCLRGVLDMDVVHVFLSGSQARFEKSASNIKKLILAMVDDARIVIIKLAERLVVLRHCRDLPEADQIAIAQTVQRIYAPLANRLGMGEMKWQLEDLAFRYTDREQYMSISKSLQMRRADREAYVNQMVEILQAAMIDLKINNAQITGRAKHIYSIYRKCQRKQTTLEDIYDTSATRVLVDSIEDCYAVLSMVHHRWPMIQGEFDDYIANPKPNGYQSIHTAIIGPNGRCVEIQIRTFAMHEKAEMGVASHWTYKEGASAEANYQEKIDALRHLLAWQADIADETTQQPSINKLFADQVYVFTPNGDVVDLPSGSTPLDFAYHIHTDVGHRCKGAKVNGQLVTLTSCLKTGDQVDVVLAKQAKPSRDWLNPNLGYLKTHRAQSKVAHWFRRHQHEQHMEAGHEVAEKLQRKHEIKKTEWQVLAELFHFKSVDELYAALGSGDVGPATLLHRLQGVRGQDNTQQQQDDILIKTATVSKKTQSVDASIAGVDSVLSHFAQCCKPVPGDPILAYVATAKGIVIHHADCPNLNRAAERSADRVFEVSWGKIKNRFFVTEIQLLARDRKALLADLSHVATDEKIRVLALNAKTDKSRRHVSVRLSIEVDSIESLEQFMRRLRQMPDVSSVERV